MLAVICLGMSSCFMLGYGGTYEEKDSLTKAEIQQMINNSMGSDVTIEGGDNINVTINGTSENNAAAGKALLSAVSIRCIFKVASYGSTTEKSSAGSGVIYKIDKNTGDAYVITNYHVVYYNQSLTSNRISNNISIFLYGQESEEYAIPATYVGGSMNYDIAILKVNGSRILAESNAAAVEFSDSDNVAVLDQAIAVGNPEAHGISATLGYINVDSEYINMEGADGVTPIQIRVMRTDTAVNGGNSGGGLFNSKGELIGIVNAKLSNTENMGYAIPANFVRFVVENILYYCDGSVNENVYRCYLGITVTAGKLYTVYDQNTGKLLKREAVKVESVEADGLADGAIKAGDIINSITVDGVTYTVDRMYKVTDSMLNARVGSKVSINLTRGNSTLDVEIVITESSMKVII